MKGDRERCLAAGMDAYVSKPLEAQQLFAVIDSVLPTATRAESGAPGQATPIEAETGTLAQTAPAEAVFDRDATLDRVDGNRELLQELIGLFFDEIPGLLSTIQETITQCDAKALERAAHTLKGAVGNFSAQGAYAAALRVEMIGRSGDLTHVAEAYVELEKEIARLSEALIALREENRR
jgi:HPt (histidine-containing phosphotransfer) domain-containing protein